MSKAITHNPKNRSLPKAATGIQGLDEITGGGLPRGRPTLVCGSAGCGKTLLAIEFLVRGATEFGEPGVFLAFEETADELAQNVRSLGFDLEDLAEQNKLLVDFVHVERSEIEEAGEYDLEGLFIRLGHAIDSRTRSRTLGALPGIAAAAGAATAVRQRTRAVCALWERGRRGWPRHPTVRGNATQSLHRGRVRPKGDPLERVLEEIRRIAFSDLRQIAEWDGSDGIRLTRSDTLTDEAAACIAEVVDHSKSPIERGGDQAHPEHVEILDRHVKVKLHDKLEALNLLAKHLGLLKEPEAAQNRPLFPRGFFAALITRDPSKLEAYRSRSVRSTCAGCALRERSASNLPGRAESRRLPAGRTECCGVRGHSRQLLDGVPGGHRPQRRRFPVGDLVKSRKPRILNVPILTPPLWLFCGRRPSVAG
jgi:KaiC protein/terminase small subunit-like protein